MADDANPTEILVDWLKKVSNDKNWYEYCNESEVNNSKVFHEHPLYNEKTVSKVDKLTNGDSVITFSNGDYFEGDLIDSKPSHRIGVLTRISDNGSTISASWTDHRLHGEARVQAGQNGTNVGVYQMGLKHGMMRKFGPALNRNDNLRLVAWYERGEPVGIGWKGLHGGAFIVGPLDNHAEVNGVDCVYIYPDLKTVIRGEFRQSRLIKGKMSVINGVDWVNHICVPKISDNDYGESITRDVSTNVRISKNPTRSDMWESARVEVKKSDLGPDAGEGLFARIDLDSGDICALFNGVRIQSSKNDIEISPYRIRLNGQIDLDIPDEMTDLNVYSATLGHKSNHSFGDSVNAQFTVLEHPRFGLICAVRTKRKVQKGEEILVNYSLGMWDAPEWYKALFVDHCRRDKKMSDTEILDWCGRQYAMIGKHINLPFS